MQYSVSSGNAVTAIHKLSEYERSEEAGIGQLGQYQMEVIDTSTLRTHCWITAAKLSKLILTSFTLLTIGATIAALGSAPYLAAPIFALGILALYISSKIKDYNNLSNLADFRSQALQESTPLTETLREHGWQMLLDKGILTPQEIHEKLIGETQLMTFEEVIQRYGWSIFHHHIVEAKDFTSDFYAETQNWSLRRILHTFSWEVFRHGVANPYDFQALAQQEMHNFSIGRMRQSYGPEVFKYPILPLTFVQEKAYLAVKQSSLSSIRSDLWSLLQAKGNLLPELLFLSLESLLGCYELAHATYEREKNAARNSYNAIVTQIQRQHNTSLQNAKNQLATAIETSENTYEESWARITKDNTIDFDGLNEDAQDELYAAEELRNDSIQGSEENFEKEKSRLSSEQDALRLEARLERDRSLVRASACLGKQITALEHQWREIREHLP